MINLVARIVLMLGLVGGSLFAGPDDREKDNSWPQWRGINHDSKSLESGVFKFNQGEGLKMRWRNEIGQGYSSVSISSGLAVTMFSDSENDILVALNAENGSEVWRYKIGPFYKGQGGSHDGPSSTPVIDGDYIYALGRKGKLFALKAADGSEHWTRELVTEDQSKEPFHGFTTSPLVYKDVLIVETGGTAQNTISGFDKKTGKRLWHHGSDAVQYQSPIMATISGEEQLIVSGDNFIYGIHPESGKLLWSYEHKGGGGSTNPVAVGENRLLLPYNFRESLLVGVEKQMDGGYKVEEIWKTRHIKNSFNVPVHHEGYFYGYSGRFLSCVNAENGETVWKSRPPGDGFLILVDGYLVVLTKRGSLHIAEASPEGYAEKTNLKVFEKLAWTPPSFANGRIYARGIGEIASVDIASVADPIAIKPPVKKVVAPESDFARFVKKVENASNKQALVDEFMKAQKSFPVIEKNKWAHFIYHGEVKDLVITGDIFDTGLDENMNRVAGTNLYYYTVKLEPDAHLAYQFIRNYEDRITDPLNPDTVVSFNGPESQFAMPKWKAPTHLSDPDPSAAGKLVEFDFESKVLNNTRKIQVYLPNGYERGNKRYPTVYVHYGRMAVNFGKMPTSLDNLIAAGKIQPVIAVFIHPTRTRFQEYARNQKAEYAEMVTAELVPHIDRDYRTKAEANQRLVMGGDEGGFAAIYSAFKHPGVFGLIAGQSSHLHSAEGDELRGMVKSSEKLPVRFYLDWGKYDYRSKTGDYSWPDNNRNFVKILKDKGYDVYSLEVNEGFGWTSWRTRTDKVLMTFFKK